MKPHFSFSRRTALTAACFAALSQFATAADWTAAIDLTNGGTVEYGSGWTGLDISGQRKDTSASYNGGAAVHLDYTDLTLIFPGDVTFSGNKISITSPSHRQCDGEAILIQNGSSLTIKTVNHDVVFTDNGTTESGLYTISDNSSGAASALKLNENRSVNFGNNNCGAIFMRGTVEINQNTDVTFSGNKGIAIHTVEGNVTIAGNRGKVDFTNNQGAIQVESASLSITGNGSVSFRKNRSEKGAIYATNCTTQNVSIQISGNDKVEFRGNTVNDGGNIRLCALYADAAGADIDLSAPANGVITFHDSVYIGAGCAVDLNSADGASGKIVFDAENVKSDLDEAMLAALGREATEAELAASRTSEFRSDAILHGGSLVVKNGAEVRMQGLTVEGGAELLLQSEAGIGAGTLTSDTQVQFKSGSVLQAVGSGNTLTATNVVFENNSVLSFAVPNLDTPDAALLNLNGNVRAEGSLTLELDFYRTMAVGDKQALISVGTGDHTWWPGEGDLSVRGGDSQYLIWEGDTLYYSVTDTGGGGAAPWGDAEQDALFAGLNTPAYALLASSQIRSNITNLRALRDIMGYGESPIGSKYGAAGYGTSGDGTSGDETLTGKKGTWRFAVQGLGGASSYDGKAGAPGYDRTSLGGMLMAERVLPDERFVAGLSAGYEHADNKADNTCQWKTDDVRIHGHLLFNGKQWQSRTILGVGLHDYQINRRAVVQGAEVAPSASTSGVSVNFLQEVSCSLRYTQKRFQEYFLRLESSYNTMDSVREQVSANVPALLVDFGNAWATEITLGTRLVQLFSVNHFKNPGIFMAEAGIIKSIGDEAADVTARFEGYNKHFRINPPPSKRYGAVFGANASLPLTERARLIFGARAQWRDNSYELNANAAYYIAF